MAKKHKDTLVTVAGRDKSRTFGAINPPVFHASTVLFDNYADLREGVRNSETRFFYGRKGSPTIWAFNDAVKELEGGAEAKSFPSGIAAATASLLSVLSAGDHLLMADCVYEPMRLIANRLLKKLGIETEFFEPRIGAGIASMLRDNTRAIFIESPGSLTMEIADVPAIRAVVESRNITVINDNTWATPYFHKALEKGAHLVVHAATKYIVGHSDAMLGVIVADEAHARGLRRIAAQLGQVPGPDDAYLGLRGFRTLGVRLKQHQENALKVAEWLLKHRLVDDVLYPALAHSPDHALWQRDFEGANGLFSMVLNCGDYGDMGALVDELEYFGLGFSWGGFESLILPQDPSPHRSVVPWTAKGPLVRLHIGLEDPGDLIADLRTGLERYAKAVAK